MLAFVSNNEFSLLVVGQFYKSNLCKKYKIVKDMLISLLKNKIVII